MLEVLRRIESRAIETAHRVKSRCGIIFRYAISTGRCLVNPCRDLSDALTPSTKRHFPAITDMKRFAELLIAIETYNGTVVVKSALKIVPFVALRSGNIREMRWRDVDLVKKEWAIIASKNKVPHIVPLPVQAVQILEDLRPVTYKSMESFVFPNARTHLKPMSDNAMLAALRILGFPKEEVVIHGFRTTANTELLELGYPTAWTEKMLAHAPKDAHGTAYNRTEYRQQRHKMMQAWANYLDELKAVPDPGVDALRKKYTYQGRG